MNYYKIEFFKTFIKSIRTTFYLVGEFLTKHFKHKIVVTKTFCFNYMKGYADFCNIDYIFALKCGLYS